MFGLGKIFSGIAGGFLDKIGLGFLKPFVSLAVNFFSGNYLALIGDISNLVGKFTNSSFLRNLNRLNPLGQFGNGSNCFGNLINGGKFNVLKTTAQLLGLNKAEKMLNLVDDFQSSFSLMQQKRENAYYQHLC